MAMTSTGVALDVSKPLELAPYDPTDWYWKRKNGKLFSSARVTEVSADDPDFQAWSDGTRFPTPYPTDDAGEESEAALQVVLDPFNLSATLAHYVRAASWRIRLAGTTIAGFRVTGDSDTMGLLRGLKDLAEKDSAGIFPFDNGTPEGGEVTAEQAIALYDAGTQWVQSTFTKRIDALKGVGDGSLTDKNAADAALADPPPVKASARKAAAKKA